MHFPFAESARCLLLGGMLVSICFLPSHLPRLALVYTCMAWHEVLSDTVFATWQLTRLGNAPLVRVDTGLLQTLEDFDY